MTIKIFYLFFATTLSIPTFALDETLSFEKFIADEYAFNGGDCVLNPAPQLQGEKIKLVIPARFENRSFWVTNSILLVGVDKDGNLTGEIEMKVKESYAPRNLVSASCKNNQIVIYESGNAIETYDWDGKQLTRVIKKKTKASKKTSKNK